MRDKYYITTNLYRKELTAGIILQFHSTQIKKYSLHSETILKDISMESQYYNNLKSYHGMKLFLILKTHM